VVRGRTGSCDWQGTLTVPELPGVSMPVTGDENGSFLAKLEVPGGTFPKAYKLVLSVDCHGDPQQDTAELKVENQVSIRYAASGHGVRRADDQRCRWSSWGWWAREGLNF
jgi:hypothetical protein